MIERSSRTKLVAILTGCLISTVAMVMAQEKNDNGKWSFVVVGDSRGKDGGINAEVVKPIAEAILTEKPRFVLFPGDLVQGYNKRDELYGQLMNWRTNFMDRLLEAGIKVYPVRGNHDMCENDEKLSAQVWNRVFSGDAAMPEESPVLEKGRTYSFMYNDMLFLNLDSYVNKDKVNQGWVDDQLSTQKCSFVFAQTHEPLFSLNKGHKGGMQSNHVKRDQLVDSLVKAGCVMFFCGHDHWYDHCAVETNGVRFHQFVVGTAGAPLSDAGSDAVYLDAQAKPVAHSRCYGYAVVEVDGKTVTVRMKASGQDGALKVIDEFSYVIGKGEVK